MQPLKTPIYENWIGSCWGKSLKRVGYFLIPRLSSRYSKGIILYNEIIFTRYD